MHRPGQPSSAILKPPHFHYLLDLVRIEIEPKLDNIAKLDNRFRPEKSLQEHFLRPIDRVHILALAVETLPLVPHNGLVGNTVVVGFPAAEAFSRVGQVVLVAQAVQFAGAVVGEVCRFVHCVVSGRREVFDSVFWLLLDGARLHSFQLLEDFTNKKDYYILGLYINKPINASAEELLICNLTMNNYGFDGQYGQSNRVFIPIFRKCLAQFKDELQIANVLFHIDILEFFEKIHSQQIDVMIWTRLRFFIRIRALNSNSLTSNLIRTSQRKFQVFIITAILLLMNSTQSFSSQSCNWRPCIDKIMNIVIFIAIGMFGWNANEQSRHLSDDNASIHCLFQYLFMTFFANGQIIYFEEWRNFFIKTVLREIINQNIHRASIHNQNFTEQCKYYFKRLVENENFRKVLSINQIQI